MKEEIVTKKNFSVSHDNSRKNEANNTTTTVKVVGEDGGIALPKQLFLLLNPMAASGKIYYPFLSGYFHRE